MFTSGEHLSFSHVNANIKKYEVNEDDDNRNLVDRCKQLVRGY